VKKAELSHLSSLPPILSESNTWSRRPTETMSTSKVDPASSTVWREKPQDGRTALETVGQIRLVGSYDIAPPSFCTKLVYCCYGCSSINSKRSYIYARENSIETNVAFAICGLIAPIGNLCCPNAIDYTTVMYYDRDPFKKKKKCGCCATQPKVETQQFGRMCCCVPLKSCCDEQVIVVPSEGCCCCSNRVGACDNCFGLCGKLTGNAKIFSTLTPQPVKKHRQALADAMTAGILQAEAANEGF